MVEITLNKIRKCRPCEGGWETLLKSLGKTKADGELFQISDIVDSNGIDDAIWALRCLDDKVPARLFAVYCAQSVMHLMEDERSMKAVKISHLYAHGEATDKELAAARTDAWNALSAMKYKRDSAFCAWTTKVLKAGRCIEVDSEWCAIDIMETATHAMAAACGVVSAIDVDICGDIDVAVSAKVAMDSMVDFSEAFKTIMDNYE